MKIKRPSLKGMKHTKYLGHFAQDKYIRDGHNFSGSMPLFREPSQIEMMAAGNPFDAAAELKRREQQVASEVATLRAQTADNTGEVAALRQQEAALVARGNKPQGLYEQGTFLSKLPNPKAAGYTGYGYVSTEQALGKTRSALSEAESRSKAGREASYRANRKKFLTEV